MNTYKRLRPFENGLFTGVVEIWKPVKGFEDKYEVSSFGKVKSITRTRRGKNGSIVPLRGREMKQKTNKNGYLVLSLCVEGEKKHHSVHRLVAEAFIENQENKLTVNHCNADKKNNCVSNLEWSTYSEQMQHAVANDLLELRGSPKFTKKMKAEMLDYYNSTGCSISKLSKVFKTSERTAGRVTKGVVPRTTTRVFKNGTRVIENILSKQDVLEIKKLREQGMTLLAIGKLFNRGISQIHRVTRGESRTTHIE